MEDSSAIIIDETYEYSAPIFYDFLKGESDIDVRNAELWFDTALSHAPSPFMMKIKASRSVQLSSLCDFGDAQQKTKTSESLEPTNVPSNASVQSSSKAETNTLGSQLIEVPSETKENSDTKLINETNNKLTNEINQKTSEVSTEKTCKDDRSTGKGATPDVKIETENHEKSARRPLQDVSTPKQPAIAGKGSRTTAESKKQQTAKWIASAIKNPSALKSN